jgi:Fanconi anemia group M protein
VLVATSVAEEGLDIPSTDLVIFYEPVPSEIRTIQRRGRTGRKRAGKVIVLIAKHTRDEGFYWSSINKEKRMRRELHLLRSELSRAIMVGESAKTTKQETEADVVLKESHVESETPLETGKGLNSSVVENVVKASKADRKVKMRKKGQSCLGDFRGGEIQPHIMADTREFNSEVVKELSRKGFVVGSTQLDCGDYIISDRIAVERKEVGDFLQSLMNGRLFSQLKMLRRAYVNPILVMEGEGLFQTRGINEQAIYGALASIVSDFNITVIFTANPRETAHLLAGIAKREQGEGRPVGMRGEKGSMSLSERQQFIIEGLPGISATLAQRLLGHFGSVKAVLEADEIQLCEVRGIGKTIAKGIVETLQSGFLRK